MSNFQSVATSPDGTRVALGDRSTARLELRETLTGRVLARGDAFDSDLATLQFSPDGRRILSGAANDGRIRLQDAATLGVLATQGARRVSRPMPAHAGGGELIVSAGPSGSLSSWSPDLSRLIGDFPGHGARVASVADAGGGRVASIDEAGEVRAWSVAGLSALPGVLGSHGAYVYAAEWSADGRRIVVAAFDDRVHVWDVATRARVALSDDLRTHGMRIPAEIVRAADGSFIVGCHDDLLARLDAATGAVVQRCEDCGGRRLSLEPSGARLAVVRGHDGEPASELRLLDARTFAVLRSIDGLTHPVAWSPDGRELAVREKAGAGDLLVLDGRDLRVRARHALGAGPAEKATWSPDGSLLAVAAESGAVSVFRREGGIAASIPHGGRAFVASFSPDGRRLVVGGDGGALRIFDTATWEELVSLAGHGLYVYSVAWSPDGRSLLSASGDGTVRAWSADRDRARGGR